MKLIKDKYKKKNYIKLNKNNTGSSLIIVLIMTTFVLILASSISSIVMLNLRMKKTKLNSKTVFYNSEEAVDEIYLTVSKLAMESFNSAYTDELSRYSNSRNLSSQDSDYDNTTANLYFRKNFTIRLLANLGLINETKKNSLLSSIYLEDDSFNLLLGDFDVTKKEELISKFKSYLETSTNGNLDIVDISEVSLNKEVENLTDNSAINVSIDKYILKINDINISYISSAGYYSNITIDLDIAFPPTLLSLVDNEYEATTNFSKYALIANTGLIINNKLNLYGSAYAGGESGISLSKDSVFNYYGNQDGNLISATNIFISGASFNIYSGRVWSENIFTKLYPSKLNLATNASLYLKDDLQLEADNSKAVINGNLYGYGYVSVAGSSHVNSSSMIINSNESSIEVGPYANVLLSGNAFIGYNGLESPYSTGFSYAGYGDQESYLVPSRYISSKINPVPLVNSSDYNTAGNTGTVNYKEKAVSVAIDESFFAYAFLDEENPYLLKLISNGEGGGSAYYYLNFKSQSLKAIYAKLIESDEAFESFKNNSSYYNSSNNQKKEEYEEIRQALHDSLVINASTTASSISIDANANVEALSDTIYEDYQLAIESNRDSIDFDFSNYLTKYNNYAIRYNILHKILLPIDGVDTRMLTTSDIGSLDVVDVSGYSEDVFNNFISTDGFNKYITNRAVSAHNYGVIAGPDYMLVAIDNEGTNSEAVVIDSSLSNSDYSDGKLKLSKGIVIASGDVIVKSDFTGLIMAKGQIYIEGDVNIYSLSEEEILNMIEADSGIVNATGSSLYPFKSIFLYGYDASLDGDIDNTSLDYKDFVEIKNWRN